jgi:hypothetical protein
MLSVARKISWPLLLALMLQGCAAQSVRSYASQTPGGGASYPGMVYRAGRFALHRLYSILPGDVRLECHAPLLEERRRGIVVGIQDCATAEQMSSPDVSAAVFDALSHLEDLSSGQFRICNVRLVLVGEAAGVSGSDTQWLGGACVRLRLLVRWRPEDADASLRNLLRTIGHEGYHLVLASHRRHSRDTERWHEEVEAEIVGACTEKAAFGDLIPAAPLDGLPGHGRDLGDSVIGQREAARILDGRQVEPFTAYSTDPLAQMLVSGCMQLLSEQVARDTR